MRIQSTQHKSFGHPWLVYYVCAIAGLCLLGTVLSYLQPASERVSRHGGPLHQLIERDVSVAVLRREIDQNPKLVQQATDAGWTPLHLAAEKGNLQAVKVLLANDAPLDVELRDPAYDYFTPLHVAAYHGRTAVALYLVEQGAKIRRPAMGGLDAAAIARMAGHRALADRLEQLAANQSAPTLKEKQINARKSPQRKAVVSVGFYDGLLDGLIFSGDARAHHHGYAWGLAVGVNLLLLVVGTFILAGWTWVFPSRLSAGWILAPVISLLGIVMLHFLALSGDNSWFAQMPALLIGALSLLLMPVGWVALPRLLVLGYIRVGMCSDTEMERFAGVYGDQIVDAGIARMKTAKGLVHLIDKFPDKQDQIVYALSQHTDQATAQWFKANWYKLTDREIQLMVSQFGRHRVPWQISLLFEVVGHEDEQIADAAESALGAKVEREVVDELMDRFIHGPAGGQRRMLRILVAWGQFDERLVDALYQVALEGDLEMAGMAIGLLMNDPETSREILIQLARSETCRAGHMAVEILGGQLDDPEVYEAIEHAASAGPDLARASALRLIAGKSPAKAVAIGIEQVKSVDHPMALAAIAQILDKHGGPNMLNAMRWALRHWPVELRQYAAAALEHHGNKQDKSMATTFWAWSNLHEVRDSAGKLPLDMILNHPLLSRYIRLADRTLPVQQDGTQGGSDQFLLRRAHCLVELAQQDQEKLVEVVAHEIAGWKLDPYPLFDVFDDIIDREDVRFLALLATFVRQRQRVIDKWGHVLVNRIPSGVERLNGLSHQIAEWLKRHKAGGGK